MRGFARNMKNLLVVNVNWLGDVIFSSPVFRALRKSYPDARISCLAVPRVREILESIQEIDDIIIYDEDGRDRNLLSKFRMVGRLRRENFDAVFLLSKSRSRASMMKLAGIPVRVGYENKNRGRLLSHIAAGDVNSMHRSDYYLGVIEAFGVAVEDRSTILEAREEDCHTVQQMLSDQGRDPSKKLIALNPGGNWDLKRWPAENFARLAERLSTDKELQLVFTGADKDRPLVEDIFRTASFESKPIKLTGQMTLKQLTALMTCLDVFVTADSGPLHMATSVGCPTVSVFGPTRPEITGPRGTGQNVTLQKDVGCNRRACYHLECRNNICMQAVTVENVYEAIKSIQDS